MIAPAFYKNTANQSTTYLRGKFKHFKQRTPTTVVGTYEYVLSYGDTMYNLAERLFGADSEHLWYILSDINQLRMPDEWVAGEKIKLPEIIVQESATGVRSITNVRSVTAVL